MDLDRIKARGRSTTGKAFITNPIRSLLWKLTAPYFYGVAAELENDRARLDAIVAQGVYPVTPTPAPLQDNTSVVDAIAAKVASQLAGIRKDGMAVAHRLAGLEEEAVAREASLAALTEETQAALQSLAVRLDATAAESHEAGSYVTQLHEDFRSFVEATGKRIDALQARDDATSSARQDADQTASAAPGTVEMVSARDNTRFLLRRHDLIGGMVAAGQEWEPHVREAIEKHAQADGVAIDAGAFIGLHTVTMSRCFQKVYAFEPQRDTYQLLSGNLALNACRNVSAQFMALYDRPGRMVLASQDRQEVPMFLTHGEPDYAQLQNAAALTFDFMDDDAQGVQAMRLDDMALARVDLIKVDTQGADLRVLLGAQDTIRRCRPVILFEWERDLSMQHGSSWDDYKAFFDRMDYTVSLLHDTSPGRQADYLAKPN